MHQCIVTDLSITYMVLVLKRYLTHLIKNTQKGAQTVDRDDVVQRRHWTKLVSRESISLMKCTEGCTGLEAVYAVCRGL